MSTVVVWTAITAHLTGAVVVSRTMYQRERASEIDIIAARHARRREMTPRWAGITRYDDPVTEWNELKRPDTMAASIVCGLLWEPFLALIIVGLVVAAIGHGVELILEGGRMKRSRYEVLRDEVSAITIEIDDNDDKKGGVTDGDDRGAQGCR